MDKYADYHQLLDRKDIDGVIVATFDHVHAQIAIDACKAGKDVYVEKPMTSLPEQGPPLVKAVRETNRIVQVGTQQRTTPHFLEAKQKFFDSGLIGKVNMVRTIWNANGGYLTPVPKGMEQKPAGLDWDACLAWLPKIPWDPKRYFNRFAYWDFSTGGQTGGLFVHMVDVVHWFLNIHASPDRRGDGRHLPLRRRAGHAGQHQFRARIPREAERDLRGHPDGHDPGRAQRRHRLHGYGRQALDLPLRLPFHPQQRESPNWPKATVQGRRTIPTWTIGWTACARRKQPNADVVTGHYSAQWPVTSATSLTNRRARRSGKRSGRYEHRSRRQYGIHPVAGQGFRCGVERAAKLGYQFVEPMVHNGREL